MTNDLEFDDLLEDEVDQAEPASLSIADDDPEDLDDLLAVDDSNNNEVHEDELPAVEDNKSEKSNSIIDRFLRDRGIADPTKLKFEKICICYNKIFIIHFGGAQHLCHKDFFADPTPEALQNYPSSPQPDRQLLR